MGIVEIYFKRLPMMNKSKQLFALNFRLLIESKRLNTYFCIVCILLTGCTSTQVRWDATRMREEVMVYYNDQILDNLIRAKNRRAVCACGYYASDFSKVRRK